MDDNQGIRLVSRLTGTPYYDELSEGRYLVHLGMGYAYTRPRRRDRPDFPALEWRPVSFNARPEIHRGDFLVDTDEINTTQYHMLDAEFAWVHGPLSVQSEFVYTSIDVLPSGLIDLYGAYVQASYFLTGENRVYNRREGTFGRVVPYENAWLVRTPGGTSAGWGAWELAARWSYLDMSQVRDQQLHDMTLGVNWYLNPHSRVMLDWIHPMAHNSPASALRNAAGDILAMRVQVDF